MVLKFVTSLGRMACRLVLWFLLLLLEACTENGRSFNDFHANSGQPTQASVTDRVEMNSGNKMWSVNEKWCAEEEKRGLFHS